MIVSRRQYLRLLAGSVAFASPDTLLEQWKEIASGTDGMVGAAVLDVRSGRGVNLNGHNSFPLASVCKLPIAMRVLSMVDDGILHRAQEIEVLPGEVWRCWEGDIGDLWPAKKKFTVDELLQPMVSHSDNTAVHTLFRVAGERKGMEGAFRKWGIAGFRVDRYEGQSYLASHGVTDQPPIEKWQPNMARTLCAHVPTAVQYAGMKSFLRDDRDTATPLATVQLLSRLYEGRLLSPSSTACILELMKETATGDNRIRRLLPRNVAVGDKTGTWSTIAGLNGATNDVGLIMPQGGQALAIAVYIKGSTRDSATREKIIARLAKSAFDRRDELPTQPDQV